MKEEKQETGLKLSRAQLQTIINEEILRDNGLNELFKMLLNGLMKAERQSFLEDDKTPGNKGNGYRQVLRSGIGSRLELQVPRDRMGVFKPVILGVLDQQEEQIKNLCFELYGKGLTTRQIEKVIENIYGTHYSKSSISRITTDFGAYINSWLSRPLDIYYPIVYIDAIHIKVRRDTVATEAFYVLLGLKDDYTREVLGIVNIPQESALGWREVLQGIKQRGVAKVGLFVFDGLIGLDTAVGESFADAKQQQCVLHFQRNLNKDVRKSHREDFSSELKDIFNPDQQSYDKARASEKLNSFISKWGKIYPKLKGIKERYHSLFTYLEYNYTVRRMIYTTNWIERLNKSFRRTLKMRNALPSPESAIILLAYTAIEMGEGAYSYSISNFKNQLKDNLQYV